MNTDSMEFTGPIGEEFLFFTENKKVKVPAYKPMQIKPTRETGSGKLASPEELIMTLVIIGQDLIRDLLKDFIKARIDKPKNFTVSYTVTNENKDTMTITEKDLTKEEVDERFAVFKGNIVGVETVRA